MPRWHAEAPTGLPVVVRPLALAHYEVVVSCFLGDHTPSRSWSRFAGGATGLGDGQQ
ncbi:hypothetical protein SAMN05421541_107324 [Actinoplanes philippinensis]|uniref:Uncharacterized protein n=1 Tax=Actinoplanes philippinensis TaxID=35752 RepID=A0A1I2H240_9ACTN|nr:hypothetical protein SAMN05421541_107324 [Actinoplanes philippinensis]